MFVYLAPFLQLVYTESFKHTYKVCNIFALNIIKSFSHLYSMWIKVESVKGKHSWKIKVNFLLKTIFGVFWNMKRSPNEYRRCQNRSYIYGEANNQYCIDINWLSYWHSALDVFVVYFASKNSLEVINYHFSHPNSLVNQNEIRLAISIEWLDALNKFMWLSTWFYHSDIEGKDTLKLRDF